MQGRVELNVNRERRAPLALQLAACFGICGIIGLLVYCGFVKKM